MRGAGALCVGWLAGLAAIGPAPAEDAVPAPLRVGQYDGDEPDAARSRRHYNTRQYERRGQKDRGKLAGPVVFEIGDGITPEDFRLTARQALVDRGWRLESETATRLQGRLVKWGETFKAEVRLENRRIVIGFVPGFHHDRDRWLRILEGDIRERLARGAREAEAPEVARPSPAGLESRQPASPSDTKGDE